MNRIVLVTLVAGVLMLTGCDPGGESNPQPAGDDDHGPGLVITPKGGLGIDMGGGIYIDPGTGKVGFGIPIG